MTPLRFRIVNGCILLILGITLGLLVIRRDCWPLCNYPMFETLVAPVLEFYTVADGKETFFDYRYTWMIHWEHVFSAVLSDYGWPSAKTQAFYFRALRDLQRESRMENPAAPAPTALRAYLVYYHYPDSGDFQPIELRRAKILEVDAAP
jgi:hypothetical protein